MERIKLHRGDLHKVCISVCSEPHGPLNMSKPAGIAHRHLVKRRHRSRPIGMKMSRWPPVFSAFHVLINTAKLPIAQTCELGADSRAVGDGSSIKEWSAARAAPAAARQGSGMREALQS